MPIQAVKSVTSLFLTFECTTFLLLLLDFVQTSNAAGSVQRGDPYFVVTRFLRDGERDRRMHYREYTARETAAVSAPRADGDESAKNAGSGGGIRLLQITDGRHFVQAIYDADYNLKDCEYVRDKGTVAEFLDGFEPDFKQARKLRQSEQSDGDQTSTRANDTVVLLKRGQVKGELRRLIDYKTVRSECKTLHGHIKDMAKSRGDKHAVSRQKRELLIYPGTNWCGVGTSSDGFNELGWNAASDRCCRQHDHCPYTIERFATKYNLFNYRFHTLSHCECDERFRTCLKMVDNGPSNLVGKLFFNVVQMKCFVLKTEKNCVKRSWWGRCLKHEKQLTAHMKDVLTY